MIKKIFGMLLVFIIMINCLGALSPASVVCAFNNFDVEVVKNNAPLREGYYESEAIIKRYPKGTVITVVGEKKNFWGNLWYKIKGGGYIYSENVKKTTKKHEHSYKLTHYENAHPHYANYACSCGSGYCGTETKKVDGCSKCYPHQHSYKLTHYEDAHPHYANYACSCGAGYCGTETKKVDGCSKCYPHQHSYQLTHYEDAHPHYANYKCSCGAGYCGTETKKVDGCSKCYPHQHSYKLTHYEDAHPHYANYACSCGAGYCGTETKKVDGCSKCYPKEDVHKCEYEIAYYENAHPHYAIYECDCGNGYCGTKTKKMRNCSICYPEEDDEDSYSHSCKFVDTGKRKRTHPHYVIESCSVCGKERDNSRKTEKFFNCLECINGINYNNFNSPINFDFYSINDGRHVYVELTGIETEGKNITNELHTMLDVCGFAAPEPFAMVCDGINVAFYLIEGDLANMAISGMSFVPIVGYISGGGKLYKKTGTVFFDAAASSTDDVIKATTRVVVKNQDLISDAAEEIVKNSAKYSDEILDTITKISDNKTVSLNNVYNNGELLISKNYSGTVKSSSGLSFTGTTKEGHRLHHVLERHGSSLKGTPDHGTLFNVDGKELFDLIDDVYAEGKIVGKPILQPNGNTKIVYQAGKNVGFNGETKIEFILKGKELITAYPVK